METISAKRELRLSSMAVQTTFNIQRAIWDDEKGQKNPG